MNTPPKSRSNAWKEITRVFSQQFYKHGFDIVHPFSVQWYNRIVDEELQLPTFNRDNTLGLLIGNTKFLWPHFQNYFQTLASNNSLQHPLDSYTLITTTKVAQTALKELNLTTPTEIRYAWETEPGRLVAIQKLSHYSGFAYLNKDCYLNIHPIYGPWIAFRAVIVLDVEGPPDSMYYEAENPCPEPIITNSIQKAMKTALSAMYDTNENENENENEKEDGDEGGGIGITCDIPKWRYWVKIRDTIPIGKEWRYSEKQIEYHYTKNTKNLLTED